MKQVFRIFIAAAIATTFALPAFAETAPVSQGAKAVQTDAAVIAQLHNASQEAQRQARGNKNNPEFQRKGYQIDQLIERMKSGQKVDPAELDRALEPARVW